MSNLTQRLGGARASLAFKAPCRVGTTANITLSGFQTVDGVVLASTDEANGYNTRVLVKNQTDASENGIYVISSGSWTRARDFDGSADIVKGTRVAVAGGTVGQGMYAVTSADPIEIDTDDITIAYVDTFFISTAYFATGGSLVFGTPSDVTLTHSTDTLTLAGGVLVLPNAGLQMGSSVPFSDSSGTLTLQNVDALDATTEATIEAAIDTLANLTSVQGRTVTLAGNLVLVGALATAGGAFDLTLTLSATSNVTLPTTGTLATLAGAETLSGKTLTAPKIANAGFLADANGNELIIFTTTGSAVNEITYANAATGNNPSITASGETNVSVSIAGKGTGGVILGGTSTNDAASAGKVGEYISSTIAKGSAVSLSTGVPKDVTSISLTAGDWDVWGIVNLTAGGSTTSSDRRFYIHTVTNTLPTLPNSGGYCQEISAVTFGNDSATMAGQMRISLSATTTIYLGAQCAFAVSTLSAFGHIGARRVR